jgi:hypothetical protein
MGSNRSRSTRNDGSALGQWHDEIARGIRTKYTTDALWRAACREKMAGDFERQGLPEIGQRLRREAAELLGQRAKTNPDRFEHSRIVRGRRL